MMETIDLFRILWFVLIGILLAVYSILDGFDLGIGCLFKFLAKDEKEKKILFNSVSPFWDGNEVWLLTGGGALFASFPFVYATVFSGFYLALMLVLFALIFRAVSLEFWHYDEKRKKLWEWAFIIGSFVPSLLFGVALGNVIVGIPLNSHGDFTGNFFTLLRPYPLVIGLLGLVAILMQGSTFVIAKSTESLQERAKSITKLLWVVFIVLLVIAFIFTYIYIPKSIRSFLPWFALCIVLLGWILNRMFLDSKKDYLPFYMSSLSFLGLWGIVGGIQFPNLVNASNDTSLNLTIYNSSSSELTLKVMSIIALIGVPIVIFYTIYVYRVFKGKTSIDTKSY